MPRQVTVSILNWAAPLCFPGKIQTAQAEVLAAVTQELDTNNIGAVLTPVFAYRKGFLWKAEHATQEALANVNLNLDRNFALIFGGKADDRETRPPFQERWPREMATGSFTWLRDRSHSFVGVCATMAPHRHTEHPGHMRTMISIT